MSYFSFPSASQYHRNQLKSNQIHYRFIIYVNQSTPAVNYRLNGMDFVAAFGPSSIYMSPFPRWYDVKNINDLPDRIIDFIQKRGKPNPAFVNTLTNFNEETRQTIARNNEFEFTVATVYINLDGTKTYDVII